MSRYDGKGLTQEVVGSVVAGLVAAADCRQDALWTAMLEPSTHRSYYKCQHDTREAAVRMVSAVLALEAEEGLEEVGGCSQQGMADHVAEEAGS